MTAFLNERDRRYEERFRALETAMEKAVAAVEKQTAIAFTANKEAINKAEEAQQAYNTRSNEFRGQLDDQAKRLMARDEALSKFKAYDEKFEGFRSHFDERADDNKREIIKIREQQMAWAGKEAQRYEGRQHAQWSVGQAIAVALVLSGFVVTLVLTLLKR